MSAESHARAMRFPIRCQGAACQQGHCLSPMKCSGSEAMADEAIAQFRTAPRAPVIHRKPLPPQPFAPGVIDRPERDSCLLSSPDFWISGAICLLCWFALYLVITT